ncbi:MFS general substrate transporter [Mytilinidion resinicola]|uniref:MFS general substrate transporter n=1 Tax=Mytilinidion resinicola TaxID=574789 RepID=A0A6A6YQH9_9PEZI|nr:MFS general substrate transporter [Mytilinidion resinicola]KAF2810769.1 MFS general substrate transporter [Mytilinidion resinicola]
MAPAKPLSPDGVRAADETTPLLVAPTTEPNGESATAAISNGKTDDPEEQHQDEIEEEDEPLPIGQILLLCFARLMEPIAFFGIFPFLNKMIHETGGVDKADVGFYSGLIESLFSLTQVCVMIAWGRAADRIGRKPVLVFSLCGVTIATGAFGFSTSFWQMAFFRCLAGVFAGTIVTIRAMISENSTKKTQAQAFSWFAFSGYIGISLGPFIGGTLENPAEKFAFFKNIQLFKDFPYALPTIAIASFGFVAAVISALFIKETLHRHESKGSTDNTPPKSTWEIIKAPGVAIVLGLYGFTMLMAFAYTAVLPVYLFTDIKLGGLQFPPLGISIVMGVGGLAQAVYLLLIFTPLQKRFGTVGVMRLCAYVWPFFFSLGPILNTFRRHDAMVPFWVFGPSGLALGSGVAMAFTAVQLALNDISPSHKEFGTLNALALATSSGTRAFAPALATSIYAVGVGKQIAAGHLFWLILIATALLYAAAVRWLPKKAEGKYYKKVDTDDA